MLITILLGALVLCIVLPDKEFSEQENRKLEAFPSLNVDTIIDGSFMQEFEQYSSDHVVGRDFWMKLKNSVDRSFGKHDNGSAYWGKHGYLFPIEYIDEIQLEKNLTYIYDFSERAHQLGVKNTCIMPVPTSQEILSDFMPDGAERLDQQQVIERTKSELESSIDVIDVSDALKSVKDSKYIYYKTDHHWTQLGAYYSYKVWADANKVQPIDERRMNMQLLSEEFYGTTYSKIPTFNLNPDAMYTYRTRTMNEVVMEIDKYGLGFENAKVNNGTIEVADMFDEQYLKVKDKYAYFLSNNHPLIHLYRMEGGLEKAREQLATSTDLESELDAEAKVEVEKKVAENEKESLLIIKDSYANCFIPFLTEHYDDIYVVDLRYYKKSVLALIEEYQIDELMFLYNAVQLANDRNLVFLKAE